MRFPDLDAVLVRAPDCINICTAYLDMTCHVHKYLIAKGQGMASFSSRDLIRMLEANGWSVVRVKGSHHHFRHPTKPGTITVPHPAKDMKKGTVRAILKQAGLK